MCSDAALSMGTTCATACRSCLHAGPPGTGALRSARGVLVAAQLAAPERQQHPEQLTLAILAPGVEARRLTDLHASWRLVDVAVECDERLVAPDRFADRD